MILVLAGTSDGRQLIKKLVDSGHSVLASCTTEYGKSLIEGMHIRNGNCKIQSEKLDAKGMKKVISKNRVQLLLDATHPFAQNASINAIEAARLLDIPYVRFERDGTPAIKSKLIYKVKSFDEAARLAFRIGSMAFLSIGSRNLAVFVKEARRKNKKFVARILPDPDAAGKAAELGIKPNELIAAKGPFSYKLNKAMFEEFDIDCLVTKDSGKEGGTDAKIKSALKIGAKVIIIERPKVNYPLAATSIRETLSLVKKLAR